MNVIVQSKTLVVTAAMRAFAQQQLRRLGRYGAQVGQVTLFLENIAKKKNDVHAATAKVLIDLPGKNIVIQEKAKDMYAAIGRVAKAAANQLAQFKHKHHHISQV